MTFPTGVVEIRKCPDEELKTMLDEAREASKHSRKLGRVMGIVAARRLQQMKDLLALEKLATWRRMNGFDRVADGEDNWFHGPRSLPPTPEEFAADLWSKVNELKNAISMPAKTRPWQKTMEFLDGLKDKLPDEELAVIKRYVERRSREAAQMIATTVDIVQYCSPCPLNPEMPPDVCTRLESDEGKVDPELKELESPSACTGLETPGQQCSPSEGTWETGRTTADGFLTAGVGPNLGKYTSPTTERVNTRAVRTTTATFADISSPTKHVGTRAGTAATPAKPRHKPTSEENKQFDPGGKEEKPPPWNAAVILSCFSWGERWAMGGSLLVLRVFYLCFMFFSCLLCSLIIVPFR